jgi:hypothetical protein
MVRALNSAAISLRVSGIWSSGAGWQACSVAAVMVRKARASMARVVHRYQESQRRTWCSSSPASSLPAWKFSSVVHLVPATVTRAGSGTGRGL